MAHTLLLVEPNATIQRVVELTFAGEGVTVVAVPDGDQALERIGRERPHVVLADVAAPRRNGYEIAEHVKGLPGSPPIPVLLMAGAFERVDEQRAKEVGCDGVLVKPFEPRQLVQRVRGLLGVAAPRPAVATPPPAPPAVEPSPLDRFIAAHAAGRAAPATPSPGPQPPPSSQPADDAGARALDDYFDELDAMFAPGHGAAGAQAVPPAVPPAPPSAPTRAGAPPAPAAAFSPGPAADEIDFGFDELDAVFASASAAASPPGEMPSGWDAPIAPPESSAPPAAPAPVVPPPVAAAPEPPHAPPFVEPPPTWPAERPAAAASVPVAPAALPSQPAPVEAAASAMAVPPPAPPTRADAPAVERPPVEPKARPAAGEDPEPSLADAFAAMLAAEEGAVARRPLRVRLRAGDEILIERTVERIMERVNTSALRDAVAGVVADLAREVLREEVEQARRRASEGL